MPIANRKYVADAINKKLGKDLLSATSPGEAANKYYLARMIDIANEYTAPLGTTGETAYGQTVFNGGERLRAVNTDSADDAMRLVKLPSRRITAQVFFSSSYGAAQGGRLELDGGDKTIAYITAGQIYSGISAIPSITASSPSCIGAWISAGPWPPERWFDYWGWGIDAAFNFHLYWSGYRGDAVSGIGEINQTFRMRFTPDKAFVDYNEGIVNWVASRGNEDKAGGREIRYFDRCLHLNSSGRFSLCSRMEVNPDNSIFKGVIPKETMKPCINCKNITDTEKFLEGA